MDRSSQMLFMDVDSCRWKFMCRKVSNQPILTQDESKRDFAAVTDVTACYLGRGNKIPIKEYNRIVATRLTLTEQNVE